MRLEFLFSLVALLSPHSVLGMKAYCGVACEDSSKILVYQLCSKNTTRNACRCGNPAFLGTFALCIQDRCDSKDNLWKTAVRECAKHGGPQIASYHDVLANATHFVQHFPSNIHQTVYAPVRIPDAQWYPIYHTSSTFHYNMRDGTLFGWTIAVLSGITCLFAGVRHLYLSRSHASTPSSVDGFRTPDHSSLFAVYIKKHLLMPAFLGKSHAHRPAIFGLTVSIPTRLQTILLVCYVGLNVISLCVRYTLFLDNTSWPGDKSGQLTRYVADRSGILAFSNIPLLIAFAGRNNILIWLTGSSFVTFNVFHKWIGRVCVTHAFIHSIAYTVRYWRQSGAAAVKLAYMHPYLRYGAAATTAGTLLLFQGMHIFRLQAYDTFLLLHIALSLVFIIGCWYHVHLIPYDEYMPWLYTSVALWAFDRVVRVLRIVWWNVRWSRAKGLRVTKARIMHLEGGFVRLDINPVKGWRVRPGQYIYLYVVGSVRETPWQSHPFTIYDYHVAEVTPSPAVSPTEEEKKHESGSHSSPSSSSTFPDNATITLYIRSHNGMTSRLAKHAHQLPDESVIRYHPVLIEGPYGHSLPLRNFENVTLIAGGVGITALMLYFKQLSRTSAVQQRVHMIWIIHELTSLSSIYQDLLALSSTSRRVSIYVTTQDKPISEVESRLLLNLEKDFTSVDVTLGEGRPNCTAILADEAETLVGSLAVVACGPGRLIDDCRAACVKMVDKKRGAVEFFCEEFGW